LTKKIFVVSLLLASALGFILGSRFNRAKSGPEHRIVYYVDPMHPAYHSANPGKAPDCGMDLVPVYADGMAKSLLSSDGTPDNSLGIDSASQQLFGMRLYQVRVSSPAKTVRVLGRVVADETRVFKVNLGTDGYVKETHADAAGNRVKKNQRLATIYSPDFLAVAGGFLSANERSPGTAGNESVNSLQNSASAQARADRLRNLGMSDVQIEEIVATRKIQEDVYVVSPTDGVILSRRISAGLRFDRQTEFYTIADLSHVWIVAEIYESELNAFRPGASVRVTLPATHQIFQARISNVLPEVDPSTHTVKLRLEADNPGYRLRPEMFVDVDLPVNLPQAVVVPTEAVIDSGLVKRVFVQTTAGHFLPREVTTGWEAHDMVQVLKGLTEGEIVAASGTYLIDSESRLGASGEAAKPTSTGAPVQVTFNAPQSGSNQ
jgi:Cu(I)/Ag(I) efflux system membrane fusion protein